VENFVGACKREREDVFRLGAGRKFRVSCGGESERAGSEIGNDRAENIRSSFRSSFWSSGSHEIRVLSRVVSVTRHIQGGRYFSAQVFGRDRFLAFGLGKSSRGVSCGVRWQKFRAVSGDGAGIFGRLRARNLKSKEPLSERRKELRQLCVCSPLGRVWLLIRHTQYKKRKVPSKGTSRCSSYQKIITYSLAPGFQYRDLEEAICAVLWSERPGEERQRGSLDCDQLTRNNKRAVLLWIRSVI
jgi:hypothetical protein